MGTIDQVDGSPSTQTSWSALLCSRRGAAAGDGQPDVGRHGERGHPRRQDGGLAADGAAFCAAAAADADDEAADDGPADDGKPDDGKPDDGKPDDGQPNDGKPADAAGIQQWQLVGHEL